MPNTTTYAAYDESAIWGTGATPEAAIADATQWVNPEDAEAIEKSCSTAIMTPALAAIVASSGGNTNFDLLPDGTLGTGDEAYEAA